MKYSLAGYWQLSPLTDLTVPQDDICFPAPLSEILPVTLSETEIAAQEWHLMHDIEVDDALLGYAGIDLVLEGIDHYAEIRLNGVALFDCDGFSSIYRKDIRPLLQPGRNRFEILFLEPDDEPLVDVEQHPLCFLGKEQVRHYDSRVGIWREPYLQCIRHVRLTHLATEQVWHHGGGCELLVHVYFDMLKPGLVSAVIKFDGMSYQIPIDMRSDQASAVFQVDAPRYFDPSHPDPQDLYVLTVQLDGQEESCQIGLSEGICVTHFPL
ncbi:glycosyl hydrolase 2 galactose-binding domain-containing protein [Vibrio gazogenes]|uniref:Beta-galactosidase n=1 Tax=Vibrio gazogenes TaxID=687 RepID=A0A1Z2SE02_VIBGA|nr:beta-galactosidase [Vibrio gazogenes]ASA55406.1 beta-galactosidase [Vibrio gazogenes]